MNRTHYLIVALVMSISTAAWGAQVSETQKELNRALVKAKTVEEAQRLIDQGAEIAKAIEVERTSRQTDYRTLICCALLDLNKDPKLIDFFASQGVTVRWGGRSVNPHHAVSRPLLHEFISCANDFRSAEVRCALDQVKDRCARVMRAGALISDTAGDPSYSFTEWLAGAGAFGGQFSPYHATGEPVVRRYLLAFTQTMYDVGREQCLVRSAPLNKRLKEELLEALPLFSSDIVGVVASYERRLDAVSEKELEELAKIKALLDQEEVQRFMQEEAAMASRSAAKESV